LAVNRIDLQGRLFQSGSTLGTSKRYADHYDRLMAAKVNEGMMRGQQPDSLQAAELQLDLEPLTRAPEPRPVKAWVRYGTVSIRVDAMAVAWTEFAVAIKWTSPDGEHRAWLWGSAVRARS
jgi:hypothetical protein